jgi:anti-sigma regulatory factor (Ser/Thr protein kinase)
VVVAAVVHRLLVDPQAPKRARDLVSKISLSDDASATLELIVSELVTNVVLHGAGKPGTELSLALQRKGERIRGEVCGSGPDFTWTASEPDLTVPGGLGLLLVDELSDRWGIRSDSDVCVWFECVDCVPR